MTLDELKQQVQVVAKARRIAAEKSDDYSEAMEKWKHDNESLIAEKKDAEIDSLFAESKLRELTLAYFRETGEKKPLPELGIRVVEKLEYDLTLAFGYAKEHGVALKLDVLAFDKMAKISELRPGFVTVTPVATATIARNLKVE